MGATIAELEVQFRSTSMFDRKSQNLKAFLQLML